MTIFSDHDSNPGSDQSAFERLPSRFPIFPLSGAILLPGGNLPLNIFEPRYLQMVKDAMRGEKIIGMIQPKGPSSDGNPTLYPIGCIGKITNFEATEDGRNLVTLTGICRFEIVEELTVATPYRQAVGTYENWRNDLDPPDAPDDIRSDLVEALRSYFAVHDISVDWEQIERAPLSGLMTSLAMICPFEPSEKQALLELSTPSAFGRTLVALLKMGSLSNDDRTVRH